MEKLVLWVDDLRDPPNRPGERYIVARSVNEAKNCIEIMDQDMWMDYWIDGIPIDELHGFDIIDLDHDSGIYFACGGDYINLLNYLEKRAYDGYKINFKFRIHSFNPVGVVNMRAIIKRNGWEEVR